MKKMATRIRTIVNGVKRNSEYVSQSILINTEGSAAVKVKNSFQILMKSNLVFFCRFHHSVSLVVLPVSFLEEILFPRLKGHHNDHF